MTDQQAEAKPSNLNIPNALTAMRLLLVPVFAYFLLAQGSDSDPQHDTYHLIAAVIFIAASFTDYLDGALARKHNIVTTFGKVADPIADKALTGVALIGLSILDLLPWWVTIVILVREIGVTVIRFMVLRDGVIPASRGGKSKTVVQMTMIIMYLLPLTGWLVTLRSGVMLLAVALTVATGIDYVFRALTVHRNAKEARAAAADGDGG